MTRDPRRRCRATLVLRARCAVQVAIIDPLAITDPLVIIDSLVIIDPFDGTQVAKEVHFVAYSPGEVMPMRKKLACVQTGIVARNGQIGGVGSIWGLDFLCAPAEPLDLTPAELEAMRKEVRPPPRPPRPPSTAVPLFQGS